MAWWKNQIPKLNKRNREPSEVPEQVQVLQKRVKLQALTILASVALVCVLVFAMTAAWYTNVAKTSDLTFQAEAWGYEAERITVAEEPILVSPGSSGFVPLTVDNSGRTEGVKIGVTVSKVGIEDEELRKRIYFYADTGYTSASGENVSRVYLGASQTDGYTYTILPGQKLTLTETYYNDVPIKWMWVYDMLGYYFRGTVTTEVTVDEYLRPIEYDYTQAVFDEDENSDTYGRLLTADGLSRADFLLKLSGADGYEGTIGTSVKVGGADGAPDLVYYPVEVDEDGYGVWAYLCTREEIEEGIAYDNLLAQQGTEKAMNVTIAVTAVNAATTAQEINSAAALETALANSQADVIKLQNSISLDEPLNLTGDGAKVIDLNGYQLDYDGTDTYDNLFSVTDGASLTMMNGNVHYTAGQGEAEVAAFAAAGADLTLSNVTVTGFDTAVDITDKNAAAENPADSTVRIIGCTFDTVESAVELRGNGSASEAVTKVVIEDSKITSGYIGISGLGATDNWGTELVLLNSTIDGYYAALYQPQQKSSTTISGCTLSGITGIAVKGGTVTIEDSTITGTGEYAEAANASSGFTDTGDGVYVEAGYNWSTSVILQGENEIISKNAYAVELYGESGKGPGTVRIKDGTFIGSKGSAKWNGIGTFEIYGGTFAGDIVSPEETPIVRYD